MAKAISNSVGKETRTENVKMEGSKGKLVTELEPNNKGQDKRKIDVG